MQEAILVSLTLASILTINDARNIDFGIAKRIPEATPEASPIVDAVNVADKLREKRKLLLLMPMTSGEEEMIDNSDQIEETTRKSQKTKRCKTPFRRNRISMSIKSRSNDENANSLISNENNRHSEEYPLVAVPNLRRVSPKDRKTLLNDPQSLEKANTDVNSKEYINLLKAIRESQSSRNYDVDDHEAPTLIDNRYVCYCAEKNKEHPFSTEDAAHSILPKGSLLRKNLEKINRRKLVGAKHKKPILENLSRRLPSRRLPKLHSNRARYSPNSLRKKIKPSVQAARENDEVYMPAVYGKQPEFFLLPAESSEGGIPIKIDVPFSTKDRAVVTAPRASFSSESEENSGEYRHASEQESSIVGGKRFEDALETSTVYLRNEIDATTMESGKGLSAEVGERLGVENGERLKIGNGDGSKMEDGEGSKAENGERLKIGNNEGSKVENGEGSKVENGDESEVENGGRSKVENGGRSKLENGERSKVENEERLKLENRERSKAENGERSKVENGRRSKVENGGTLKVENGEGSKVENGNRSKVENGEGSKVENEERSKVENGERSKVENGERSKVKNGGTSKVENGEGSKVENGERSKVENGGRTKLENGERSKVENEERLKLENRERSKAENGERSKVENGRQSKVDNGERLKIGNNEGSKVKNGEGSKVENGKRSKVENGEHLKIGNNEGSKAKNGERSKVENEEQLKSENRARSTIAPGERLKLKNGEHSTTDKTIHSTIDYKTNDQDSRIKPSVSKLENSSHNMDSNDKKIVDIDNCIKLFGSKTCIATSTEPSVQKDNNQDDFKKLDKNFSLNEDIDKVFNNHGTTPYSFSNVQTERSQVLQQTTQSTNADNKLNKDELKNMSNYSPISTESSTLITASDKNSRNYTDEGEVTSKVGTNVDRSSSTMISVEENTTEKHNNSTTLEIQSNKDKSNENPIKSNRKINDGYSHDVDESKSQSEKSDDLVQSVNPNAKKASKNWEKESIFGKPLENLPFDYSQIKEVTVAYFTSKAYENETDQPTYFSSSGPSSYDNFYITANSPRDTTFMENQNNGGNVQSDQLDLNKSVGNSGINVENKSRSNDVTSTNLLSADKEDSEETNAEKNVFVGKSRINIDRETSTIGDMKDADSYLNSRNENDDNYDSAEGRRNSLSEDAAPSSEVIGQERGKEKKTELKEDDLSNDFTGPFQMEKPNSLQDDVEKNVKPLDLESRFQSVEEDGDSMVLTTNSPIENTSVTEDTHSKPNLLNDNVEKDVKPFNFESTFASIEEDEEGEISVTVSAMENTSAIAENHSKPDLLDNNVEKDVNPVNFESTSASVEGAEEAEVSTQISPIENTSTISENHSKLDLLNKNVEKDVNPANFESTIASLEGAEEVDVSTPTSSMENTSAIAENHSKPDLLNKDVEEDVNPVKFESTMASIKENEETHVSTTISSVENTASTAENHSKPDLLNKNVEKDGNPVKSESTIASVEGAEEVDVSTPISPMENTSTIAENYSEPDLLNNNVDKDDKLLKFETTIANIEEVEKTYVSTPISPMENTSAIAETHSKPDLLNKDVEKDVNPVKVESTIASIKENEETPVSTTISSLENTATTAENHSKPNLLNKDFEKNEKPVIVKSTLASLEQNEKPEDSTSVSPIENTSSIEETQAKSDFQNDEVEKDLKPNNFKPRFASVEEDEEPEISIRNSPMDNTSKIAETYSKFPDSQPDTQDFKVAATHRAEPADNIVNSSQDSLPFCDNTLLQKSIKTVINRFAAYDPNESTENTNGEIVDATENLLPEITEIPNLKRILSLPRVENTIANKVKNRLARITGIARKNFDSDWATNVIKNNLRHMMAGVPSVTTELPPFSVVEHEFNDGSWRTHVVTLVPSTENESKGSNHLNKLRESVRDFLKEPAVNSQVAKQPILQNIIVQSVKDGLELENVENTEDDRTKESKIRNILSEELQNTEAETEDIVDTSSKPEILNVSDADIGKIIELTRDVNLLSESADDKSSSWETTPMEDENSMILKDHEIPENEKVESSYRNAASMEEDLKGVPEVRFEGSSMDEGIKLHKNEETAVSTEKLKLENNEELLHYMFPKDSKVLQPSEEFESSTASGSLRFTEETIDPTTSREFTGEVIPPGMKKSQKSNVEMSKKHLQELRNNSTTMKTLTEIKANSKVSQKSQEPKNINYSSGNKIESSTASKIEFLSNEETMEKNLTYFGKIAVQSKNSTDNLRNLLNSDLYYIGDGVKLPLEIRKLNDGSYGLSISRKLCEHVLNRKCPCCVPTEGNVLHSKKSEIDVKDNGKVSDKGIKARKKKETRRTRRFLVDDNSQTFSMPVEAFAKKYNLSLNLEGVEKLQNSAQDGKTWRKNPADVDSAKNLLFLSEVSEDRKSMAGMDRWKNIKHLAEIVADEIRDRKLMKVKNSNSIEQEDRATSNRYRNTEGTDMEYQRENPILNRINYVKENQKAHGQYRYQRNVNVNTNKRLEVVKSVLNWLKSVILSADAVTDNR